MGDGVLVVLEGVEGAGKSTQAARLSAALVAGGRSVRSLREPGGTPAGDAIRALLLDPGTHVVPEAEALLFLASRAQLVRDVVRPALAAGEVVVLDRFILSTYAYQVAGRGLDATSVRDAARLAVGDLVPDLTVVLDVPLALGFARAGGRGAADRMEAAGAEFHGRVAAYFTEACTSAWQGAHPEVGPVVRIEATGDPAAVAARMTAVITARIPALASALGAAP